MSNHLRRPGHVPAIVKSWRVWDKDGRSVDVIAATADAAMILAPKVALQNRKNWSGTANAEPMWSAGLSPRTESLP